MAFQVDLTAFSLADGEPLDFVIEPVIASDKDAAGRRAIEIVQDRMAGRIEERVGINRVEVCDG